MQTRPRSSHSAGSGRPSSSHLSIRGDAVGPETEAFPVQEDGLEEEEDDDDDDGAA